MLTKLSLRNAGRTWKDYLVFFVTLVLIAAIMFSFNGLLFDPDIRTLETAVSYTHLDVYKRQASPSRGTMYP